MHIYKSNAARITGVALIAGLAAGGLLAISTPTHMRREGDSWREMIGVRDVAVQDAAVPVYAPPEDLTPVHWQSAAEEYLAAPAVDWWSSASDDQSTDAIEPLPADLADARVSEPEPAALRDDEAAATAEAALAAAQDVRAQENAATDPQASAPATPPQSDAGVS